MKTILSLAIASLTLVSALASCAPATDRIDSAITVASSAAAEYAAWLDRRLDTIPDEVVLGVDSDQAYGVDMSDFENEGYLIRRIGDEVLLFGKTADGLDRAVRKYAKAAEAGDTENIDTVYLEGERIKRLTIAGNDISEYTIVYDPAVANENMTFAAEELQRLIEKACGALLPIADKATGRSITLVHSDDESLKNDGYKYSVTDGNVTIAGAVDRGCSNGVWRFLQHELDWKELIFGDSYLTPAEHVDVAEGTARTETPSIEYLQLISGCMRSYRNDRASPTYAQSSYGPISHACHGMQNNMFCDEDYSLKQICYTSEWRYEECLENVEIYIQNLIAAGQRVGYELKKVDIAQGDNSNYCLCKDCNKVFKEEGNVHSGAVVRFANRLSAELDETHPGIVYQIFAYAGTNTAPKITRPSDLVHITFCFDGNCTNHILDGSQCDGKIGINGRNNKDYDKWLRSWCEISKNVYVWLYALNTPLQQYTVVDNTYYDFKYFDEVGIRGLYYECHGYGLNVRPIEHQLIAELNWNMDMTPEEYEAMFCSLLEKEYGDGWEYIREYFVLWQQSQRLASCWQCWGWTLHGCWDYRYNTAYYAEKFDHFLSLMENALFLANSRENEGHIELLSCHVLYEGCYSSYFTEYLEGDEERIAVLDERYTLLMARLRKNGFDPRAIHTLAEGADWSINFSEALYDEAWSHWTDWFETITGQPIPEDAPVIKETE